MIRKENTVIIVLVVIAIIFALINLSSINNLSERLAGTQGNIDNLCRELREVSDIFQAIQEQTSWYEFEEIEIVELGAEQITIKIGCYIREYREGSKVLLNYRRGNEDYTALETKEDTGGHFHALLKLELKPEPLWMHHYSQPAWHGSGSPPEQMVFSGPDFAPEEQFEYYIAVVDGDLVRTGEAEPIPLEKVNLLYYSSLDSQVEVERKSVSAWLMETQGEQQFAVTAVRLELCRDGRVVDKLPLSPVKGEHKIEWQAEIKAEAQKDYDALCLVVTFSDGKSFTQEAPLSG